MVNASEQRRRGHDEPESGDHAGSGSRDAILAALAANLVIAAAKLAAGLVIGSPALLSEAAHSVADSVNEIFLLTSVYRARKAPDPRHPFGYGKERFFWSFLAAVGIFVTGGCFSLYQGVSAWRSPPHETSAGLAAGVAVMLVALLAESASLAKARRRRGPAAPCGGIGPSLTCFPNRRCAP